MSVDVIPLPSRRREFTILKRGGSNLDLPALQRCWLGYIPALDHPSHVTMPVVLNHAETREFVARHAAVLDAPENPTNPFSSAEWLSHFSEQIVADDWRVLALQDVVDGGSLMLLYSLPDAPARCFALSNYYASLYSPLASLAKDRAFAVHSLVRQLSDLRPRIATVQFAPLDAQTPDTRNLQAALASRGWYVRPYFAFGNWTLPCDGLAFDDYMAHRDSQVRNTLSRKSKKLLAAGELRIYTQPDEVDAGMDAYDAVYASSWKQPEPYPGFVRGWARRCAARGWLRLGVASVGGVPIAAQLWFTISRRAYIFKLAYDEAYSKWSAGTVLTAHLIRHALEKDRVAEIDYLTGDDPYKKVWMSDRRERIGLIACNLRSPQGLLAAVREMAGSATSSLRAHRRKDAATSVQSEAS